MPSLIYCSNDPLFIGVFHLRIPQISFTSDFFCWQKRIICFKESRNWNN